MKLFLSCRTPVRSEPAFNPEINTALSVTVGDLPGLTGVLWPFV